MRPEITKVTAIEKYKLFVRFDDGVEGILDLGDVAGKGVFSSWDVKNNFFEVYIGPESKAITWPDEIDIDTYNAYCIIKGISPEDYFTQKEQHATNL